MPAVARSSRSRPLGFAKGRQVEPCGGIMHQGVLGQTMVSSAKQVSTKSGAGPTDAALVIAARGGEEWAFEALFRRHANLVFGLSYRLLPRDSEVDDIVQDVFSVAFERLGTLQNPQAFAAWLASIVVNTVSKRLRRRRLLERLVIRTKSSRRSRRRRLPPSSRWCTDCWSGCRRSNVWLWCSGGSKAWRSHRSPNIWAFLCRQ